MVVKVSVCLILMTLGFNEPASACTSFALYGSHIFFGMNFDYFSVPLKFLISSGSGMNIFHLAFLYEHTVNDPKFKNYFAPTCGMNNKGLFCSCQEVEPFISGPDQLSEGEIRIDDQYEALTNCSRVDPVLGLIKEHRAVQNVGPSLHNLFADIHGNAVVSETDNNQNFLTRIQDDFIVMTNFPNHSVAGKFYKEARGTGADRYIIAHEYLLKHKNKFNIDKGFELLKNVSLIDPDCMTLCSMVFVPRENHIYIALNRDIKKVWKVSLAKGTIETFRGHNRYAQVHLGPEGIMGDDLFVMGA